MKTIPTIFLTDPKTGRVIDEQNPECRWVFAGEGIATRKYDGVCCAIIDGAFYKRLLVKAGQTPPADFLPTGEVNELGQQPGWILVGPGPEDRWLREAWFADQFLEDGTYEAIGPMISGNAEHVPGHVLVPHDDADELDDAPHTFDELRSYLAAWDIEGIVWHHPGGRMAKIKRNDFGIKRLKPTEQGSGSQ